MALPSVEKTWDVDLNHRFGNVSDPTDHRNALFHIVDTLLNWPNNPWTLIGSSDSSTAGYPGPGWSDYTDIVHGYNTEVRSWIVLEKGDGEGQLLLHISQNGASSYDYSNIIISWDPKGGFSGGSITASPTLAATAVQITSGVGNSSYWLSNTSNKQGYVAHMRHSQDGKHDYIFICTLGVCQIAWFFTTPEDRPAAWNNPGLFAMVANPAAIGTEYATLSYYYSTQLFRGLNNSDVKFQGSMVIPGYDGSTFVNAMKLPSVFDSAGAWPMTGIELATNQAAGYGALGRMPDLWAASSIRQTGDHYPADGTKTFAQFGDFIVPWDGTTPYTW